MAGLPLTFSPSPKPVSINAYSNLIAGSHKHSYALARYQHAFSASGIKHHDSKLLGDLPPLPYFAVIARRTWVYNTQSPIHQGARKETDDVVLKEISS